VAQKFKDQLSTLVYTLTTTSPHYIRCLKPNTLKKSDYWDPELVLAQLRYAGMMETIRIRRLGYPIRMGLKEFFDRYRMITLTRSTKDLRADCQNLLNGLQLPKDEWQLGQTKVFLRENIRASLEDKRNSALKLVVIMLQKWWRGALARKKYNRVKKAAVSLQSSKDES
jgi:myosin heavy subunit